MIDNIRKAGEFSWFHVMTKDFAHTKALYAQLFGWTYSDIQTAHGLYSIASCHGSAVGGISDIQNDPGNKNQKPYIGIVIRTDSADETAKVVTGSGGRLLAPPFDIMGSGRMCVFVDPDGAEITAWETKDTKGTDIDPKKHGAPGWIELLTKNSERSAAFYAKVFGWIPVYDSDLDYTEFKIDDKPVAGMMGMSEELSGMSPCWSPYFSVTRVDETVRDCEDHGGLVLMPPTDIQKVGRFATMQTLDGITFNAIAWKKR